MPATQNDELIAAFGRLVEFLGLGDLTQRVSEAEHLLLGADLSKLDERVGSIGLTIEVAAAAVQARNTIGRLNDVVHACVIAQSLRHLLQPGEVISNRPSLAAGNDPSRPFDVETHRRVAEFKVSIWKGADAMRKRGVFADLVHLALDGSGRQRQLFVVGPQPIHFLRTTRSSADWGLNRSSASLRDRFTQQFGPLTIPISEFTSSFGAEVELVDLRERVPELTAVLAIASEG
jgi:hypothetical protein